MKSRIPNFTSLRAEREFWQTHDVTEFLNELTPVTLEFTKPARKASVSVRLSPREVQILRDVLARLTGTPLPAHHKR